MENFVFLCSANDTAWCKILNVVVKFYHVTGKQFK